MNDIIFASNRAINTTVCLAVDNAVNDCAVDPILFGQHRTQFALGKPLPDILHIVPRQSGIVVVNAPRPGIDVATAHNGIIDIIPVSSEPQVRRVAAGFIVATVENKHGVRYQLLIMQHPSHPMRRARVAVNPDFAITMDIDIALVRPALTLALDIDLGPKAAPGLCQPFKR